MSFFKVGDHLYLSRPFESLASAMVERFAHRSAVKLKTEFDHLMDPRFKMGVGGKLLPQEKFRFHTQSWVIAFRDTFHEMGTGLIKFFGKDREVFVRKYSQPSRGTWGEAPNILLGNVIYVVGRTVNDSVESVMTGGKMLYQSQSSEQKWLGVAGIFAGVSGLLSLFGAIPTPGRSIPIPRQPIPNGHALALVGIGTKVSAVSPLALGNGAVVSAVTGPILSKVTDLKDKGELPKTGDSIDRVRKDIEKLKEKITEILKKNSQPLKTSVLKVHKKTKVFPLVSKKYPLLDVTKKRQYKPGPAPSITNEKLIKLLRKHNGDTNAVAREIGYSDGSVVRNRIRRSQPGSKLKKLWKKKNF